MEGYEKRQEETGLRKHEVKLQQMIYKEYVMRHTSKACQGVQSQAVRTQQAPRFI